MENQQNRDKEFYFNSGNTKNAYLNRRNEFRKYLDKTGVLDKITGILMDLYEFPALNLPVLDYVRNRLTDTNPDTEEIAKLRPELEEAKLFRDHLERENRRLKLKLNLAQNDSVDAEEVGIEEMNDNI